MTGFQGLRHLLASVPAKGGGSAGFQTVAAAEELADRQVERLVGGFRGGSASRQLLRWDDEGTFCVLTTFTPLGGGPDGRRGNYLAESLVVPTEWLAGYRWDPDAAFAAVDWLGPAAVEGTGGSMQALSPEELPAAAPGPLDRLAALAREVPGDGFDRLLLAMVRASGGRTKVLVVEGDRAKAGALDRIVSLLPLAVPPACRRVVAGGLAYPLELRTRGPAEGMQPVHLAGVAADDRDAATDLPGHHVVDLGGGPLYEDDRDPEGYGYASWVKGVIDRRDWGVLDRVYQLAEAIPGDEVFRRFPDLLAKAEGRGAASPRSERGGRKAAALGSTAPAGATPQREGARATSPVRQAREQWDGRRKLETVAAAGHDGLQREVDELVGLLRTENERAVGELRETIRGLKPDLVAGLAAERKRFETTLSDELGKATLAAQARLHDEVGRALKQLREEGDLMLADLRRDLAARGGAEPQPTGRGLVQGMRWVREQGRARPWGWAAGALAAVLLVLVVWLGWERWGPDGPEPEDEVTTPVTPAEATLAGRLADPGTARELLTRAATDPETAEAAAATALALGLATSGLPEEARCLLLQATLRDAGTTPFAVDGACGPGTATALAAAVQGTCCAALTAVPTAASPRAACHLARELELGDDEGCGGADSFAIGREWSRAEAARALGLVRTARTAAGAQGASLRSLDLGQGREVLAALPDEELSARQAGMLFELARELAGRGGAAASAAETAALIDRLGASPTPTENEAP